LFHAIDHHSRPQTRASQCAAASLPQGRALALAQTTDMPRVTGFKPPCSHQSTPVDARGRKAQCACCCDGHSRGHPPRVELLAVNVEHLGILVLDRARVALPLLRLLLHHGASPALRGRSRSLLRLGGASTHVLMEEHGLPFWKFCIFLRNRHFVNGPIRWGSGRLGGGENASGGRGRSLLAAGSVLKEGECWQGFFPLLLAVAHKGVERGGGGGGGRGKAASV
jgi:hypothetical protein